MEGALTLEIEAKFSVPDEKTFQRLLEAEALAGFELGPLTVARLYDLYLDTPDWAILRQGYALRIRRQADRYRATIKGLGSAEAGIHRRAEYETDLPALLPPDEWPPCAARDLALRLCDRAPLEQLFALEQTRHSRPLREGGRDVATLALDRVRVRLGDRVADSYLELEVELEPKGQMADLEAIRAVLLNTWGLRGRRRSKFERALALFEPDRLPAELRDRLVPPSPERRLAVEGAAGGAKVVPPPVMLLKEPGLQADDPMSEAGRKTLRFHFRRLLYHEPGTRLGEDSEALHDMRVATRRMRAAFRVFGAYFKPSAIAGQRKDLKRTGRVLGAVRDLDVFQERVTAYCRSLPQAEQHSLDGLLAELTARRQAARQKMLAYLDGERYARFKERMGQFVETEGLGSRSVSLDEGDPHPFRVRHVAPVVLYERLAVVRAYDEWVSVPDPPLKRLHSLRIACKHLRYALEFFQEVLGPDIRAPIKTVVAVQDHLGSLQDAVVACRILEDYAGGAAGRDPGLDAYWQAQQATIRHLVDTFPQVWEPLKGPAFSEMMAQGIKVL